MLLTACFMLKFDKDFIDRIVLIIYDQITVLYGPISAHEVFPPRRPHSMMKGRGAGGQIAQVQVKVREEQTGRGGERDGEAADPF